MFDSFFVYSACNFICLEQKNLPRKMRRKLEAAREMLEDENQMES